MNLRFVEAFYWVVALKSVSRAAEKLFITQSAMSSRIRALEEELGTLLLDRRDKQFRLTLAGSRFHSYAERLLALQREAKTELGSAEPRPLALRIGAIESVLHSWLIDWVQHMNRTAPHFQLELAVETTPILLEQLRRGTLDIAFAALPAAGDGLRSRPLPPMAMVFVGHREHHKRRRYTLRELAGFELLTFQRGSQPHVALLDLLRAAGCEPKRVHAISSISAMLQLVERGFGVATLPLAALRTLGERGPLKALACDAALAPLPVHVSHRVEPGATVALEVANAAAAFNGVGIEAPSRSRKSMTR